MDFVLVLPHLSKKIHAKCFENLVRKKTCFLGYKNHGISFWVDGEGEIPRKNVSSQKKSGISLKILNLIY
jgi:hypothetical protein